MIYCVGMVLICVFAALLLYAAIVAGSDDDDHDGRW